VDGSIKGIGFHPTLVLAQRDRRSPHLGPEIQFPSHIGSRSTQNCFTGNICICKFPSHIGSRSTFEEADRGREGGHVSIPHWFSLNGGKNKDAPSHAGFHPTLVLAQQASKKLEEAFYACFHPTLVLAQQSLMVTSGPPLSSFHPTLVLAQLEGNKVGSLWLRFPSHIGSRST